MLEESSEVVCGGGFGQVQLLLWFLEEAGVPLRDGSDTLYALQDLELVGRSPSRARPKVQ